MGDECKCGHSRTQHQCDEGCFAFAACRCEKFTPAPMSDMIRVPAEKIAALREAVKSWPVGEPDADYAHANNVRAAARAVVDAVETEEGCATCGHPHTSHTQADGGCGVVMMPKQRCSCTRFAAHMDAPDELTAQIADVLHQRDLLVKDVENAEDALDALRERIRALADEWENQGKRYSLDRDGRTYEGLAEELRGLLGDA